MDLYKLHNIARREIKLRPGDKLYRKKYSVGYLKHLAETYEMRQVLDFSYCCRGEDHNCWIDVEGIDYGWMWVNENPAAMPQKLFNFALGILKSHREALYNRKMFVKENDDIVELYVYCRDVCKHDYVLTFAKRKDVEVYF